MSARAIAAHNRGLHEKHPDFIRCRLEEVTGSLVRKLRVCRSNLEWIRQSEVGNQNARDTVDALTRPSATNGN